jgi:hypothetical protein
MAAARRRYDLEPQARIDERTGETYYLHQATHESRPNERATGYVDPYAEFNQRAYDYRPEEIEGFERVTARLARDRGARGETRSPPPRTRLAFDGERLRVGPFAGFTKKLEELIHPQRGVREVVATLGPKRGDQPSPRRELEGRGCFFQEECEDGTERYAMMKSPPKNVEPLKDEEIELDAASLEAVIQEHLRVVVKLAPFSYRFYWV